MSYEQFYEKTCHQRAFNGKLFTFLMRLRMDERRGT